MLASGRVPSYSLDARCRRFRGFGIEQVIPEHAAALDALAMIGGREAIGTGIALRRDGAAGCTRPTLYGSQERLI
jgi:hypothetical protein